LSIGPEEEPKRDTHFVNDKSLKHRLKTSEAELANARRRVDDQLTEIYKLEALGQNDAKAQQKLEGLLKLLEAAQQRHKDVLQASEDQE
jgi:hypothetical protein